MEYRACARYDGVVGEPQQGEDIVEVDFGVVAAVFVFPAFGVLLGICGVIEQKRQRRQRAAGLANQASSRQFNIILPGELADAVNAQVASGAYATGNDVILASVRALIIRDRGP